MPKLVGGVAATTIRWPLATTQTIPGIVRTQQEVGLPSSTPNTPVRLAAATMAHHVRLRLGLHYGIWSFRQGKHLPPQRHQAGLSSEQQLAIDIDDAGIIPERYPLPNHDARRPEAGMVMDSRVRVSPPWLPSLQVAGRYNYQRDRKMPIDRVRVHKRRALGLVAIYLGVCLTADHSRAQAVAGNGQVEDAKYFIARGSKSYPIGTLAAAPEICSLLEHPLFGETDFIKRGPMRTIRAAKKPLRRDTVEDPWGALIDSDELSRQWLTRRLPGNTNQVVYFRAVERDNIYTASRLAEERLTNCLKILRQKSPERYKNVVAVFKSTPFPLATCLDEITETKRSISDEGKISEQVTTKRVDQCYNVLPGNIYNNRLIDLFNMVLLREAHPVLIALLDEAEKDVLKDNETEKLVIAAKKQEMINREAQRQLDSAALGPEFQSFSSTEIAFDASPGMGNVTGVTIGRMVRCLRSTPSKPEVTVLFQPPNKYMIRTVEADGSSIDQTFYVSQMEGRTGIAIPRGLKVTLPKMPQSNFVIENGRLIRPSERTEQAISKDQEALAYMQIIVQGDCHLQPR